MEGIESRRRGGIRRGATLGLLVASASLGALAYGQRLAAESGEAAGREAFVAAYDVFLHPRCKNCHPAGDAPLQGEDSHVHSQNVKRGPDGRGRYAYKCANCHQAGNLAGVGMPPGNPNWRLPPPEMPLVFQGKSPAELARHLKDPKQNGGKTLEELIHHVAEDTLVLWGWDPGEGRTRPPLAHAEFVQKMQAWVEAGAPIP
jgi:mono/diheme cytochrome c family protein